ncbi:MAG: acyl-CoA dehydrogenase family protein [Pseudomonadota bacterium]
MDLSYSKEEEAFRLEVRLFLEENLPDDMSGSFRSFKRHTHEQSMRWHRILYAKGWVAPGWPEEYGGAGWTPVQQYIFEEEAMLAGAPRLRPFALKMIGPVLQKFGSPEQKERFLPKMLSGEEYWCQGFSEPGSGSDLASLKTRALRDSDGYIVNGSKTWTTTAQHANWMFALVRTDTEVKPQAGISMLLIDMAAPGLEVRPIRTIDGDHHVNEVFFDNVRVPADHLVGEENRGWDYAKFLLSNERVSIANVGQSKAEFGLLLSIARREMKNGRPLIEDPHFQSKLADLEVLLIAQEVTNLRMLSSTQLGGEIGALSSFLKLRGTEIQQRINELAMEAAGPLGAAWFTRDEQDGERGVPDYAGYGTHGWLFSRAFTIFGGSSEIVKSVAAKHQLGL